MNRQRRKPSRYMRPETERDRVALAARLDRLAREAEAISRDTAGWADLVTQETEARLDIDLGDYDPDAGLVDPVYDEALDRLDEVGQLAAAARVAAEQMRMPGQIFAPPMDGGV